MPEAGLSLRRGHAAGIRVGALAPHARARPGALARSKCGAAGRGGAGRGGQVKLEGWGLTMVPDEVRKRPAARPLTSDN